MQQQRPSVKSTGCKIHIYMFLRALTLAEAKEIYKRAVGRFKRRLILVRSQGFEVSEMRWTARRTR